MASLNTDQREFDRSSHHEPDSIAAYEFDALHSPSALKPEERLQLAVFEEAIANLHPGRLTDLHQAAAATRRIWDAVEWFQSEEADYIFAFETICERFGFDPDAVRKQHGVEAIETELLRVA